MKFDKILEEIQKNIQNNSRKLIIIDAAKEKITTSELFEFTEIIVEKLGLDWLNESNDGVNLYIEDEYITYIMILNHKDIINDLY